MIVLPTTGGIESLCQTVFYRTKRRKGKEKNLVFSLRCKTRQPKNTNKSVCNAKGLKKDANLGGKISKKVIRSARD